MAPEKNPFELDPNLMRRLADASAVVNNVNQQIQASLAPLFKLKLDLPVIPTTEINRAVTQFSQMYQLAQSAIEPLHQHLAQHAASMNAVSRQLATNIAAARIAFDNLIDTNLLNRIQQRIKLDQDSVDAFNSAGWSISPSMPQSLRERVVSLYYSGKTAYISQTILGYYRRRENIHLIETVNSWQSNALFEPRMHILNDALDVHCEGRYTLSVPALAPQIEGILNDYVVAWSLPAKLGKIARVYETVIGNPKDYEFATWTIAATLLHMFQSNTYSYTEFEVELEKSMTRRKTNRHTVLHGIDVRYNKPINSLKQFVLLDSLSMLTID